MKTVVITGSARGLGFNMARFFREYNYNVVISYLKEDNLIKSKYCNTYCFYSSKFNCKKV